MGKRGSETSWSETVEEVVRRFGGVLRVEAVIVFGSWARGGGGDWSDVDVMIVSDDVKSLGALERFKLVSELRPGRADVFIYAYDELERMLSRGNALAISALAEGIPVVVSDRVRELMERARRMYVRVGRVWILRQVEQRTWSVPPR